MAERLVGNVDSVASAGYLIPTSQRDARWIADRTPYGEFAEADGQIGEQSRAQTN